MAQPISADQFSRLVQSDFEKNGVTSVAEKKKMAKEKLDEMIKTGTVRLSVSWKIEEWIKGI